MLNSTVEFQESILVTFIARCDDDCVHMENLDSP